MTQCHTARCCLYSHDILFRDSRTTAVVLRLIVGQRDVVRFRRGFPVWEGPGSFGVSAGFLQTEFVLASSPAFPGQRGKPGQGKSCEQRESIDRISARFQAENIELRLAEKVFDTARILVASTRRDTRSLQATDSPI